MPETIPEPFVWDESFCVFYKQLDDEHKGLFQGIFDCAANKGDAGALKTLSDRVSKHFRNEEGAMDAASYECKDHKQKHKDFEAVLAGLSCPLADDKIHYAKDWLVNHIKGTDFKYKGKLKLAA
uniref:Hemerythrin n=2 Tax=Lophotrochozoa TaxID=1206795 RepID=A0A286RT93_9TREM|nr:hemerythrin [Marphysa sanguinea]ASW22298.1 hemerythrin [Selachohemecus olsoni]